MFDSKSIDDIANRLANAIPPSFNHLKEDMEKNFHAILQSALARLDLVSREEFEVQKAVLAKTRQKLEALEQRVIEMENKILANEEVTLDSKAKGTRRKAKAE
jgi:ubiquinone biosynthesis accessory factor UbiK